MKNQRKNHSIIKDILLSVFLIVFLEPSILYAQNTETQGVEQTEQSQEELNQALMAAVTDGRIDEAEELITQGADVDARDGSFLNLTLLHVAVNAGNKDMVELLLEHGADLDAKNTASSTAIVYAAYQGFQEIVEVFISHGIDTSSLPMAAAAGDLTNIQRLLDQGADINATDESGWTPLYWAVCAGKTEAVELLITQGADVTIATNDRRTALYQAVMAGDTAAAQILLTHGADVDTRGSVLNRSLLHVAVNAGNKDMVELVIQSGAEVNSSDRMGQTPLDLAQQAGDEEIIELLSEYGAEPGTGVSSRGGFPGGMRGTAPRGGARGDARGGVRGGGFTTNSQSTTTELNQALFNAVAMGRVNEVEDLIARGADINAIDVYGRTALHIAVSAGYVDMVELLIAQGARLDIKDNAGRVPLHYVSRAGRSASGIGEITAPVHDIIRILLDNNADINAQDSSGLTPLHYAAIAQRKEVVQFLIDSGADVDVVDNRGATAYRRVKAFQQLNQEKASSLMSRLPPTDEWVSRLNQASSALQEIAALLKRSVYYVATNGMVDNPGTLSSPFDSITTAIAIAEPGDTILIRGGTYVYSEAIRIDKSGEQGSPIRLVAYPGEAPVFDFSKAEGYPLSIAGAYWHLKGLGITGSIRPLRVEGSNAHHNILEQVRFFDNQDVGIGVFCPYNIILNCDSYMNFDAPANGEGGDGFVVQNCGIGNILIGNRAWNNADDGYDLFYAGNSVRLESCYAWSNGVNIWNHPFFSGDGNGFKLGGGSGRHILINCVAWNHHLGGFNLNGNETGVILYGCTAVDNFENYIFPVDLRGGSVGSQYSIFRNNISDAAVYSIDSRADSQFNSWDSDLAVSITDDDFLSLDDSQMSAPRNPDGSIPYNNFLRLAPDSAAIDAGTDINMPYIGTAPDLGAFEHDSDANTDNYVKMLHQYVRGHDIDKINEMLDAGTDINEKDWLGYAPLHWACYFGYADLVSLLIDKGADPNLISDTGRTCLEIATAMDYRDLAEILCEHGAEE